jgi:hypothetical protein
MREIKIWWARRMNDLLYCNFKFDRMYRVIDRVIAEISSFITEFCMAILPYLKF